MNTTQLECFLAVANFLNFSRAAEQLRITQPAVSHQISSLEDELGTKLFFRTSKSVRLTQAGHLFTQYANEILKLSGLSRARLKECQETLPQRFGIGCRNFIELRLLRPVLAQLGQEQPRLLPVLRLLPYASLENLLAEDDVQVLLSLQESAPPKAVYRELARCPLVCICTPDHPLAAYHRTGEKRRTDPHLSAAHLSSGTVFRTKPGGGRTGPGSDAFLRQSGNRPHSGGGRLCLCHYAGPAAGPDPRASLHSDPCIFHHLLWRCLPQRQPQCHTASVPVLFGISDAKRLFSGSAGLSTAGNTHWSHACCLHKNKNRPCGVGFVLPPCRNLCQFYISL